MPHCNTKQYRHAFFPRAWNHFDNDAVHSVLSALVGGPGLGQAQIDHHHYHTPTRLTYARLVDASDVFYRNRNKKHRSSALKRPRTSISSMGLAQHPCKDDALDRVRY